MKLNIEQNKLHAEVNECKREVHGDGEKQPHNGPILQIRPRGCVAKVYDMVNAAIKKATEENPQP